MILQPVIGAGGLELHRIGVPLVGTKDGTNDTFTTLPEFFFQTANLKIKVFWQGRRLGLFEDYVVLESGGAGTGYDTVKLLWTTGELLPRSTDKLIADYFVDRT